MTTLRLAAPRS